jgi:uncharacterized SAM-binding protein YcdF (DUF218 family)
MDVFAKLIKMLVFVISTLGSFITVAIVLGCLLIISLFTPVYSQAMLFVLNQLGLPNNARLQHPPTAIVVLGGGLTNNRQNDIVINQYTRARLEQAEQLYQRFQLPIIVSGKESPWMMRWLQQHNIWWVVPETKSFNTCENAKFTAQTIKVSNVILVTDPYHMNRARRQFALNGIATLPSSAPLPKPTQWSNLTANLQHSRRATYEMLAFTRDIFYPQAECRSK